MKFYPAIDLKDGQFVRLLKGDMESATVFGDDPASQAQAFDAAGCDWLHVVDLDGASSGKPANAEAIEAILAATDIHVQLGGGIRDRATIEDWLDKGVSRIVLGTSAVKNPNLVREACLANADKIAVGIDARGGRVAIEGWSETSELNALELAERFEDAGVAAIIYTDIDRDGAMTGPNVEATIELAEAIEIPVIASGGVASMDDLKALKEAGIGLLDGVIAGRAVYDGSIDPTAAVALLSEEVRED